VPRMLQTDFARVHQPQCCARGLSGRHRELHRSVAGRTEIGPHNDSLDRHGLLLEQAPCQVTRPGRRAAGSRMRRAPSPSACRPAAPARRLRRHDGCSTRGLVSEARGAYSALHETTTADFASTKGLLPQLSSDWPQCRWAHILLAVAAPCRTHFTNV
jgi:hypothetical protein